MCRNVLIDSCYAEGSSDAGIHVGQMDSAVVRNCHAAKNVAGFLIFDLPGTLAGKTSAYS